MVLPTILNLKNSVKINDLDSSTIKIFKSTLINELDNRYPFSIFKGPLGFATILDPRVRGLLFACIVDKIELGMVTTEQADCLYRLFGIYATEWWKKLNRDPLQPFVISVEDGPSIKKRKTDDFLSQFYMLNGNKTIQGSLLDEIRVYRNETQIPFEENPLQWWKKHSVRFPWLSPLARLFLAIPAGSASIERVFNHAKHLITDVRSSLTSDLVERILFCQQNMT